jgi:hypothetical protein
VTQYTNSLDGVGTDFSGEAFTRAYGEGGVSFVGPSFSRIYDTTIGPWDKFKHVIEPRVDYQYVSNVDDPAAIPGFDEVDNALGRNQIRYAIVNRLLAARKRRRDRPRRSPRSRSRRPTPSSLQTLVPIPPEVEQRENRAFEGILRIARPGLFHVDGRLAYDPYANQVTAATVTAGSNWGPNYAHFSWFGSRVTGRDCG